MFFGYMLFSRWPGMILSNFLIKSWRCSFQMAVWASIPSNNALYGGKASKFVAFIGHQQHQFPEIHCQNSYTDDSYRNNHCI